MFDKTKKFGLMCGGTGAKYEQAGKFYNSQYEECDEFGNLVSAETPVVETPEAVDEPEAPVVAKPKRKSRWSKP